jgi:hypothetical protein
MAVSAFHPIMYVPDPYAERDFFELFGFETVYEGDEFPGFLAVGSGDVRLGLSSNGELPADGGHAAIRWQFIVDDVDDIIVACEQANLAYDVLVEEGGQTHRARCVKVESPNGMPIWFEGPNELAVS